MELNDLLYFLYVTSHHNCARDHVTLVTIVVMYQVLIYLEVSDGGGETVE